MITTDLDALYKAILQHPVEDTPRLMFADALEEIGDPASLDRADFIRTQMELHLLGEPHKQVHGMMRDRGPDYFEVVTDDDSGIEAGDRVDAVDIAGRNKKYNHTCDGLLVMKVLPDDPVLGTVILSLKRDENSVSYPERKASRLIEKCNRLLYRNWRNYTNADLFRGERSFALYPSGHVGGCGVGSVGIRFTLTSHATTYLHFRRGFVSHVSCFWDHWRDWGDKIVAHEPISSVEFMDNPVLVGLGDYFVLEGCMKESGDWIHSSRASLGYERKARMGLLEHRWPSVTKWILPLG